MAKNKLVRFGRCSSAVLITVALIVITAIPAVSIYYPNEYPSYLPFVGAKYCEVITSLGRGSIVISATVQDRYLSIGSGNNNIYNNTSNTLYGIFRLQNGTDYSIRWSSFSTPEYYTAGSYNPTYTQLNVTQILNTNIEFVDFNGSDKQNDSFTFSNNSERLNSVCSILSCITDAIILIVIFWRLRND